MNKIIILFSVVLLFSGCSKHKKEKTDSIPVPVITLEPKSNQPKIDLNDIAKNLSFIRLETKTDCLLDEIISKVEIFNNRVFIFSTLKMMNAVYCFDLQGKFLFQVGSKGQGPGEYISLIDFVLDKENKCLWLGDSFNKILKYDLDGNFIAQYTTGDF